MKPIIRKFCIFLTLLLLTGELCAQVKEMTLQFPKIIGIAYITGNEVNLRKTPSATGAQLMIEFLDEGGDSMTYASWSDQAKAPGADREPFRLYSESWFPIIDQADGWSRLLVEGQAAWIKDSFLHRFPVGSFMEYIQNPYGNYREIAYRADGKYQGFCAYYYYDELGYTAIYLGKVIDNSAVMPLKIWCYPMLDESLTGLNVRKESDKTVSITYGRDLATSNEWGMTLINLAKLTDPQFESLLNVARQGEEEMIGYVFDDVLSVQSLNPNNFNAKLDRLTVPLSPNVNGSSNTVRSNVPVVEDGQEDMRALAREEFMASVKQHLGEPAGVTSDKVFDVVDQGPEFPGGMNAMMQWIGGNLKYPDRAVMNNTQGRVLVQFTVMADGSIRDAKVTKPVDEELDKEALRLIKAMPKWKPGMMNGKPVNVRYTLPITFRLNN